MFIALFLFWLVFNGRFTVEIAVFGLVLSAAILWFMCKFMDYSLEKDFRIVKKSLWMIKYVLILITEIAKANVGVLKILLSVRYEKEPVLVSFHTDLKSRVARVILANSITLTPGTITVNLIDDYYEVHCLDKSLAAGLDSSIFVKQLKKFEEIK
ncbi:MAG: Na+/H+ antiporter subunit E [Lachnospiraceae bacterium]